MLLARQPVDTMGWLQIMHRCRAANQLGTSQCISSARAPDVLLNAFGLQNCERALAHLRMGTRLYYD